MTDAEFEEELALASEGRGELFDQDPQLTPDGVAGFTPTTIPEFMNGS